MIADDVIDASIFTIENGADVILDLNGKTLTKKEYAIRNEGILSITDTSGSRGVLKTQYTTPLDSLIINSGVLNIENGLIYNVGTTSENWYTIINSGTGEQKIKIKGGTISSTLSESITREDSTQNGRAIYLRTGTLEMSGGIVQNIEAEGYAILSSITNSAGAINITGGNVINANGPAIKVEGSSNAKPILL